MKERLLTRQRFPLLVWTGLLTAWLVMNLAPHVLPRTGRLFADYEDIMVYFFRGAWAVERAAALSEYPPLPTWLFGLNRLAVAWASPEAQKLLFISLFSLEMFLLLFLAFKILLALLPSEKSAYAALLLLPPVLYFTYGRFDILPALLTLLAYQQALRKRWGSVGALLALGTLTKWYPVLLLPGFAAYAWRIEKRPPWKMLIAFGVTGAAILLAALVQGGLAALLAPYQFHLHRGMEYIALPKLLAAVCACLAGNPQVFSLFFLLEIVSAPLLAVFTRIETPRALADYSIVVIGMFILFSRIWSPQWFLWILPFLIITARGKRDVLLIVLFSAVVYLSFPVMFDAFGSESHALMIMGWCYYGMLAFFVWRAARRLMQNPASIPRLKPAA